MQTAISGSTGTTPYTLGYQYDGMGQELTVTQSDANGLVATEHADFTYDAAGELKTVTRSADANKTQVVDITTFNYDQNGNTLTLVDAQGTNPALASYAYTYDVDNRITGETNVVHPAESASYTYDNGSQLTSANYTSQTNESYAYDSNGNRTGSGVATGTQNENISDGTYNYKYDNNGNRIQQTSISDRFDHHLFLRCSKSPDLGKLLCG